MNLVNQLSRSTEEENAFSDALSEVRLFLSDSVFSL